MKLRILAVSLFLAALPACSHEPLDVAEGVNLQQFQGKWYEIAKLPRPTQANCTGTTATYQLVSDTRLAVTHECRLESLTGSQRRVAATAVVPNSAVPAKLSIEFSGFWGDYWIIDLDHEGYKYAVVGHPARQYLWILSRTPTLDKATLDPILARAESKGFDVSRLEYTPQTP